MRPDIKQDVRPYKETDDMRSDREKENIKDTKESKNIKEMARGFVGKNIAVMLRGKKSFKGRLEATTQYELLLSINHKSVLVMKHAIDYIELVDEP